MITPIDNAQSAINLEKPLLVWAIVCSQCHAVLVVGNSSFSKLDVYGAVRRAGWKVYPRMGFAVCKECCEVFDGDPD